jgi:hypothetical protein
MGEKFTTQRATKVAAGELPSAARNYRPSKLKPVDSKPDLWKTEPATMSNKASQPKNFVYPENTAGTKAAKRVRSEANKLTERQREDLFKRGMQIIYGGTGTKETVGAGH